MSSKIVLIEFKPDDFGNICEEYSTSIDNTFISDELLKKIEYKFKLIEENINEEYNSNEYSVYEFFENEDIDEIISFLEELFISEVSSASKEFEGVISKETLKLRKVEIRTLLNVCSIFELKRKNFFENKDVKIKVSR